MDSNGYNPSILRTEPGTCFITGLENVDTIRHEIFYGTGNREISKREGFWINITPAIHDYLHANRQLDLGMKMACQREYELTHTRQEFIKLIGRSYL